jgi:hypothetical protein
MPFGKSAIADTSGCAIAVAVTSSKATLAVPNRISN